MIIENTNTIALIKIMGLLYKTPKNVAGVMIENINDIVVLKRIVKNADSISTVLTMITGLIRILKMFFIMILIILFGVSEHKKAPLNKEQG